MIVAGIDPSLTGTGIAIHQDGTPIALHKIGYPGRDGASDTDRARRVVALRHEIVAYVRQFKPHIVIIESPAYASILGSACDRHGLWHYLVHEFGVAGPERYAGVAPKCLKRFVTGNGNASKELVTAEVTTWWPHRQLRNDNIADAEGLATMGSAWAGDPTPFELRRVQREALEVVTWPVMA
jgi:Holliday junction resolvasome RuvABC endonuclease subunit